MKNTRRIEYVSQHDVGHDEKLGRLQHIEIINNVLDGLEVCHISEKIRHENEKMFLVLFERKCFFKIVSGLKICRTSRTSKTLSIILYSYI